MKRKQIAVLGLGRFGASLALTLAKNGHEVLAVDASEAKVSRIAGQVTRAVQADACSEEALNALGLKDFDVVVVSIGKDIQAGILAIVLVKALGVKSIVAKAQSDMHARVLAELGVERVVHPERDMGERVAHSLVSASIIDYIDLSPDHSIAEVVARPEYAGRSLGQLNLRAQLGIHVIAIRRNGDIMVAPGAEAVIDEGDVLVVLGNNKAIARMERGR